ncbi:M56 family metallopeptidase [Pedobacter sp. V48]|uniref:M56 family metallopeptidase n=1 Tax=Pedobacter sp. V48 TaxID=509635 RepID=UPI0009FFE2D4|nr:M56 family metallopeptidase [Pedobacter sp. V48]
MEFQYALCITFFHSLWIGMILALLTSLIIVATRKSSAAIRYNLLTAVLFLFVIVMSLVFYDTLNSGGIYQSLAKSGGATLFSPQINKEAATAINSQSLTQGSSGFIDGMGSLMNIWTSYSVQIVLIWFLIICIKCIQLMMGMHAIYYLKNTQIYSAGNFWENKVTELSIKLSIPKNIQILQSGLTKVPVVAGHLKPVILIPLGLLNGLSIAEVEAIISHELAHIKRSDYLVNILQSLIEIIFFFNPAVLWLSKLIKEERENCCDDLALTCTLNKQDYIQALVSCQEFQSNQYVMALTGGKNQLLERVSRMVFNKSSSLNKMEKIILTVTLISTLVFTAAFTRSSKTVPADKSPVHEVVNIKPYQDTTIKHNTTNRIAKKTSAVKHRNTNYAKTGEQTRERARVIAEQKREEAEKTKTAHDIARQKDLSSEIFDAAQYQKEAEKYAAASQQYKKDAAKYADEAAKYAADPEHYPVPPVPVAPIAPIYRKTYVPAQPVAPKVRIGDRVVIQDQAEPKDMTKELQNDGLLQQINNFKYKLDADELIINGRKQSDAVHQKYMKKYLKNRKGTITTTVNTD